MNNITSPIDEHNCGNCRHWQPSSFQQLEEKGTCFFKQDKPIPKSRDEECETDGFEGIG